MHRPTTDLRRRIEEIRNRRREGRKPGRPLARKAIGGITKRDQFAVTRIEPMFELVQKIVIVLAGDGKRRPQLHDER